MSKIEVVEFVALDSFVAQLRFIHLHYYQMHTKTGTAEIFKLFGHIIYRIYIIDKRIFVRSVFIISIYFLKINVEYIPYYIELKYYVAYVSCI